MTQQNPEAIQQYTPEQFTKEYKALCDKTGYVLSASPSWTPTNHNTFELVIQVGVSKLEKK